MAYTQTFVSPAGRPLNLQPCCSLAATDFSCKVPPSLGKKNNIKEQYGPYGVNQLKAMADDGSFKPDMLVWAKGMANWTKAGEVPELSGLFGPPPLPGAGGAPALPSQEPPPLV